MEIPDLDQLSPPGGRLEWPSRGSGSAGAAADLLYNPQLQTLSGAMRADLLGEQQALGGLPAVAAAGQEPVDSRVRPQRLALSATAGRTLAPSVDNQVTILNVRKSWLMQLANSLSMHDEFQKNTRSGMQRPDPIISMLNILRQ